MAYTSSYTFGLNDVKIAQWNSDENYGSAVDVPSASQLTLELQTVNGELTGDDVITDVHAQLIAAQATVQFGFKNLDVYAILTGATHTQSAAADAMVFTDLNMPYFALAAKISDTAGSGDKHLFLPKCKLTEGFQMAMNYGQYWTPQLTIRCLKEGTDTYGMLKIITHNTAAAVTIPIT